MTACPRCSFDPDAILTRSWTFHVPREIESLNAHRVNAGATRWSYKRKRDAWVWTLMYIARAGAHEGVVPATGKRRVTLTRLMGKGQRAFDHDNLVGGCKIVVDAMVRAVMIAGDSRDKAEIHYAQERAAASGLRVLVEELTAVTSGLATQCGKEQP